MGSSVNSCFDLCTDVHTGPVFKIANSTYITKLFKVIPQNNITQESYLVDQSPRLQIPRRLIFLWRAVKKWGEDDLRGQSFDPGEIIWGDELGGFDPPPLPGLGR